MKDAERRALLATHSGMLIRFARGITRTDDDAQDLVQDLAVIVLSHRAGPSDPASFAAWCCGVARNVAAHQRRSHARRRAWLDDEGFLGLELVARPSPGDPEHDVSVRQQLASHLNGLAVEAIQLLLDRLVLEESFDELAARLRISPASLRMRMTRLLAVLRHRDRKSTRR
jgi:RNA polymerase sigma factor (sigma-70 family)